MNICSDTHWEQVEARIDRVQFRADLLAKKVKSENDFLRSVEKHLLRNVSGELDICRNALILSLDGNVEAVKDAYDAALISYRENKGWMY